MASSVPVIDLEQPKDTVVAQVLEACTQSGFFLVSNHGVPPEVVERHRQQQRLFFELPLEQKMQIKVNAANRGYTPAGEETLDPENQIQGDTKEGVYIGRDIDPTSAEAALPLHGANQWPSSDLLPHYREAVQAYFAACTELGGRLLHLLALALGLPEEWFDDKFESPVALLRPIYYQATASQPDQVSACCSRVWTRVRLNIAHPIRQGIFGAGAHTDYGMLTILWTDGTPGVRQLPGLQIFTHGQWREVPAIPDTFTINLGDMLERWSNGLFRSTLHRVVTGGGNRHSCAFFFEPTFTTVVEALPQCCSPDNPPRFPSTTSGQHLLDKYAATHTDYKQAAT